MDGRAIHIDHANLVFEAAGIEKDRYRFQLANVLELTSANGFDIALCLGLLYHVAKPVELFEAMVRAGAEIIVVDTEVSTLPGSLFQVMREPLHERTNAIDYEMVFYPTRQAVIDLASQFRVYCSTAGARRLGLARNGQLSQWRPSRLHVRKNNRPESALERGTTKGGAQRDQGGSRQARS